MQRLSSTLLNNTLVKGGNLKRNFKIVEVNKNENTTSLNLQNFVKAELKDTFITLSAHIKKRRKI